MDEKSGLSGVFANTRFAKANCDLRLTLDRVVKWVTVGFRKIKTVFQSLFVVLHKEILNLWCLPEHAHDWSEIPLVLLETRSVNEETGTQSVSSGA